MQVGYVYVYTLTEKDHFLIYVYVYININIPDKHNTITLPYASRITSDVFPAPLCWGTVVCRGDTP